MSEEENIKKHKIIKLSILLIILISLIFLKEEKRDWLEDLSLSFQKGEKKLELINSVNSSGAIDINVYSNNILLIKDNSISVFDIEGNLKSEKQYNFEDFIYHFGDNYIYVGDRLSGEIHKVDKDSQTINILDLKKKVFNIKEENKNFIYHIKSENLENIFIQDKNQVLIGDHSFNNKNILNYTLNPSSNKYALSLLDLEKNTIKSQLNFYGLNNSLLSTFELNDEILIYSKILKTDHIIALTDSSLYYIKDGNSIWSKSFSLIKDIYVDDKIYILYSNYLESISFDGEIIDKYSFTNDYKKIMPFKNDLLIYGDNDLQLISNNKEVMSHSGRIDKLSIAKSNIIILNNGRLYIYKIALK